MSDMTARGMANKRVGKEKLDDYLSSLMSSTAGAIEATGALFTTGTYVSDRAITSSFCGFASPIHYSGESFSTVQVYIVLEDANVPIKCSVMDANRNALISVVDTVEKTGWHSFVFPQEINSDLIPGSIFYLGVETDDHTKRLTVPVSTAGTKYAGSSAYKDYFMSTTGAGAWNATSGNGYGVYIMLAIFNTLSVTTTSLTGTKTPVITATVTSAGVRTNPFTGMGIICNKTGITDFNMIKIPLIGRTLTANDKGAKWRKIKVEVRDIDQNGTVIAVGETLVDPDANPLINVEVLLTDPATGAVKTIQPANLSDTYFIGYYAQNASGEPAWAGEGFGTVSNFANLSFYKALAGWVPYSNNRCMGIEQWLVTNPQTVTKTLIKSNLKNTGTSSIATPQTTTIEINLPPNIYGLVGKEINIYFDNLIKFDASDYHFDVAGPVGLQQNERWTFTPTVAGSNAITISVYDKQFNLVASSSTTVVVKETTVGTGVTKNCLFIGDSTTASGKYTNELLTLFGVSDPMDLALIGTKGSSPNLHEGISGWTVAKHYSDPTSSFVFNGAFDFSQYMTTHGFSVPDYVCIHLGINDVFNFSTDIDVTSAIVTIISNLESMITNIKSYNANIKIGIMLTIPPSRNQDPFGHDYSCNQNRWRYKQNWFIWVKNLINQFKLRTAENIYLIPLFTNLDTVNNMSTETVQVNSRNVATVVRQNNGVHPADPGYFQMADVIYYWLKGFET